MTFTHTPTYRRSTFPRSWTVDRAAVSSQSDGDRLRVISGVCRNHLTRSSDSLVGGYTLCGIPHLTLLASKV
jgi:hypothetical protein